MNKALTFGAGFGLGTGVMYLLDPDRGKRRRALLRDKCVAASRKTGEGIETTARDLSNRARGIASSIQSTFTSLETDDAVIVDRVRSRLGRIVSHPGAIEVASANGNVTVSGPILEAEVDKLLACVKQTHGVNEVTNNLEVHQEAGNHPALQGGRAREGHRFEFLQENWSPAARFLAGAAGASLAVYGGTRRDALGAGLGAAGLLLLTRGITNTEFRRLAGLGNGEEADKAEQQNREASSVQNLFASTPPAL
jgi:BON domain